MENQEAIRQCPGTPEPQPERGGENVSFQDPGGGSSKDSGSSPRISLAPSPGGGRSLFGRRRSSSEGSLNSSHGKAARWSSRSPRSRPSEWPGSRRSRSSSPCQRAGRSNPRGSSPSHWAGRPTGKTTPERGHEKAAKEISNPISGSRDASLFSIHSFGRTDTCGNATSPTTSRTLCDSTPSQVRRTSPARAKFGDAERPDGRKGQVAAGASHESQGGSNRRGRGSGKSSRGSGGRSGTRRSESGGSIHSGRRGRSSGKTRTATENPSRSVAGEGTQPGGEDVSAEDQDVGSKQEAVETARTGGRDSSPTPRILDLAERISAPGGQGGAVQIPSSTHPSSGKRLARDQGEGPRGGTVSPDGPAGGHSASSAQDPRKPTSEKTSIQDSPGPSTVRGRGKGEDPGFERACRRVVSIGERRGREGTSKRSPSPPGHGERQDERGEGGRGRRSARRDHSPERRKDPKKRRVEAQGRISTSSSGRISTHATGSKTGGGQDEDRTPEPEDKRKVVARGRAKNDRRTGRQISPIRGPGDLQHPMESTLRARSDLPHPPRHHGKATTSWGRSSILDPPPGPPKRSYKARVSLRPQSRPVPPRISEVRAHTGERTKARDVRDDVQRGRTKADEGQRGEHLEYRPPRRTGESRSAGYSSRPRGDHGRQHQRADDGLPGEDGDVRRERPEEVPDHSALVQGDVLEALPHASDKDERKDKNNNHERVKDAVDRSSGYYDQFANRRGDSTRSRGSSFNPATECRCVAARTGDRRKASKIKEHELRYDKVRPKRGGGPVIPDLPGAPSWRMEEDIFPRVGTEDPHPLMGEGDPVQALKEGKSTKGRLETNDWEKVTREFHHNWPRDLLPKEHPLERHFGIPATPPNFLKGPAVWGYATAYQKATQEFCFLHSLPEHPHVEEGREEKLVHIISEKDKIRATILFRKAMEVNEVISLDTERELGGERVELVIIMLETGFFLIYYMKYFNWDVRHALGFWILQRLEGYGARRVVVAGQDVRNDLEKLGIWVAHPLEIGPLVSRWYRRGNVRNFYSPTERIGLKTVAYLIHGETHLVVHPGSKKGIHKERKDALNRYLTDICRDRKRENPDGSVEHWTELIMSRNMLKMYRWRYPLRNYQLIYLGTDGGIVHGILNVEVLLLYLTEGYNDWDRLRLMQHVIQEGEKLYERPGSLRFEDEHEWDEEPGLPAEGGRLPADSSTAERSNPVMGEGDPEVEEEVAESSEEDEPANCSEREEFVRTAIKKHKSGSGRSDISLAKYHARKYQSVRQRKDHLRKWAKKAGMYRGGSLNLIANSKGNDEKRCRTCGVSSLVERCDCRWSGVRCYYPLCGKRDHQIGVCPVLHGGCQDCSLRGHLTGDCAPGAKRKRKLLAIFFHWRMFGRLTMLFPVVLAVGPYVFRSPQDTAEAKKIPALHWDVLEDLEGRLTTDGTVRPEVREQIRALEEARLEEARAAGRALGRGRRRKEARRRHGLPSKPKRAKRTRVGRSELPWGEEMERRREAQEAEERRRQEIKDRIEAWAAAPSPEKDDEPNLAAQFPRYEG